MTTRNLVRICRLCSPLSGALLAGFAQAACPTAADLPRGFTLKTADGFDVETVRSLNGHDIQIDRVFGRQKTSTVNFEGLFETAAQGPGTETNFVYQGDYRNFRPEVGSRFRYSVSYTIPSQWIEGSETIEMTVVGRGSVQIGNCRYETLTIVNRVENANEDGVRVAVFDFSPELKTTLHSHTTKDGELPQDFVYSSISINIGKEEQ